MAEINDAMYFLGRVRACVSDLVRNFFPVFTYERKEISAKIVLTPPKQIASNPAWVDMESYYIYYNVPAIFMILKGKDDNILMSFLRGLALHEFGHVWYTSKQDMMIKPLALTALIRNIVEDSYIEHPVCRQIPSYGNDLKLVRSVLSSEDRCKEYQDVFKKTQVIDIKGILYFLLLRKYNPKFKWRIKPLPSEMTSFFDTIDYIDDKEFRFERTMDFVKMILAFLKELKQKQKQKDQQPPPPPPQEDAEDADGDSSSSGDGGDPSDAEDEEDDDAEPETPDYGYKEQEGGEPDDADDDSEDDTDDESEERTEDSEGSDGDSLSDGEPEEDFAPDDESGDEVDGEDEPADVEEDDSEDELDGDEGDPSEEDETSAGDEESDDDDGDSDDGAVDEADADAESEEDQGEDSPEDQASPEEAGVGAGEQQQAAPPAQDEPVSPEDSEGQGVDEALPELTDEEQAELEREIEQAAKEVSDETGVGETPSSEGTSDSSHESVVMEEIVGKSVGLSVAAPWSIEKCYPRPLYLSVLQAFTNQFKRLRFYTHNNVRSNLRSGKLDRSLVHLSDRRLNVFQRYDERKRESDLLLMQILDHSGSMAGVIQYVLDISCALAGALERALFKNSIVMFSSDSHIAKSFDEKKFFDEVQSLIGDDDAMGGTEMVKPLRYAISRFATMKNKDKLIVVITDGASDDVPACISAVRRLLKMKVDIVAIGIGSIGHEYLENVFPGCPLFYYPDEEDIINYLAKDLTDFIVKRYLTTGGN